MFGIFKDGTPLTHYLSNKGNKIPLKMNNFVDFMEAVPIEQTEKASCRWLPKNNSRNRYYSLSNGIE